MKVLHTEASGGLGGQELRILRESEGMRERGHEVIFAVKTGGGLVQAARDAGFLVYELPWKQKQALSDAWHLARIIRQHQIDIVNTHSSWDAWLGGIVGRVTGRKVLRTRHLSTPIRAGWNSSILYRTLAHQVVTTCEATAETIKQQAGLPADRCRSIPTGVSEQIVVHQADIDAIRQQFDLKPEHIVVGTVCVLRSWKGVQHLIEAASLLQHDKRLKWLIVGDGPARDYLHRLSIQFRVQDNVIFTGHLKNPLPALAVMDIFTLLSFSNEGVSQASLQAAFLSKPLVTTSIGGLGEVCIDGQTGIICPIADPQAVANALETLAKHPGQRTQFGTAARQLVLDRFTLSKTLDDMESVYRLLCSG